MNLIVLLTWFCSLYPHTEAMYDNCNCGARGESWPQDLATPFPCDTSAPINVNTATAKPMMLGPLIFTADAVEKHYVTNTGESVIITAEAGINTGTTATGSIFSTTVFAFQSVIFYWAHDYNNKFARILNGQGYPLIVGMIFFNKTYNSYEEAKKHRDGLIVTLTPIQVVPGAYNPLFSGFGEILSKIICGDPPLANKTLQIHPNTTYTVTGPTGYFLVGFYLTSQLGPGYYLYPGSTISRNGIRHQSATVVQLTVPSVISTEQFKSFQNLIGKNGAPLENTFGIHPCYNRPVIKTFGIILIPSFSGLLPAITDPKNITRNAQFLQKLIGQPFLLK